MQKIHALPLVGLAALVIFAAAWLIVSEETETLPTESAKIDLQSQPVLAEEGSELVERVTPGKWEQSHTPTNDDILRLFESRNPENELLALQLAADLEIEKAWPFFGNGSAKRICASQGRGC